MKLGSFLCGTLTIAIGAFCYEIYKTGKDITESENLDKVLIWKVDKTEEDLKKGLARIKYKATQELIPIDFIKKVLGIKSTLAKWGGLNNLFFDLFDSNIEIKRYGNQNYVVFKNFELIFDDIPE